VDIVVLIHLQKFGPSPLLVDRLVGWVDGCVLACVDAWLKESIDGRIDELPRQAIKTRFVLRPAVSEVQTPSMFREELRR
jgi:hypothetical protein